MGGRRRAVHRCLATADVAVVRLGTDCGCLCWKPWLANAAEGRIVLAVQERRGRASKVRSADGAAMFDASRDRAVRRLMLSVISPGDAVTLPFDGVVVRTPRRDRYQCRRNVKSRGRGRSLSLSLLQPGAPEPWSWVDQTLKEPQELSPLSLWSSVGLLDDIAKLDKPLVDGGCPSRPT